MGLVAPDLRRVNSMNPILKLSKSSSETNECPLKGSHFKRKFIFQPRIFRGHVNFPGSSYFWHLWAFSITCIFCLLGGWPLHSGVSFNCCRKLGHPRIVVQCGMSFHQKYVFVFYKVYKQHTWNRSNGHRSIPISDSTALQVLHHLGQIKRKNDPNNFRKRKTQEKKQPPTKINPSKL